MRPGLCAWLCVLSSAGLLVPASLTAAGPASKRLYFPKVERLLEEQERTPNECFSAVTPMAVAGRFAVVGFGLKCREKGDRGQDMWTTKKAYVTVVDWKRMAFVGQELELSRAGQVLAIAEVRGEPWLMFSEKGELVLRILGASGSAEYRWTCPGKDCPWRHQVQVLGGSRFPLEPLRVAVIARDEYLVRLYDLHPPEKEGENGRLQDVDQLVPSASWKQEFRVVTALDEEVKKLYLNANVLTKFASYIPIVGREIGEMVEEAANNRVDGAPYGMTLMATPEHGLFLATEQPFSVTRLDLKTRKFSVRPMSAFGEHVRPLSLSSSVRLLSVFPGGAQDVHLAARGLVCEGKDQYETSHAGKACPYWRTDAVTEETTCCYSMTALVHLDLATDETRWQLWEAERLNRLVVDVGKVGATCLVGGRGEERYGPGTVALEECGSD